MTTSVSFDSAGGTGWASVSGDDTAALHRAFSDATDGGQSGNPLAQNQPALWRSAAAQPAPAAAQPAPAAAQPAPAAAQPAPAAAQPAPPKYEPQRWNDGGRTQNSNNCYSYAQNRPDGHPAGGKPQPGEASGRQFSSLTCSNIEDAAKRDGMKEPGSAGQCSPGDHAVSLVISPGGSVNPGTQQDYHWYRQDDNGAWSHKPGHDPATNVDASGRPITNPSQADRNYPSNRVNYSIDCGKLCAPN